MRRKRFSGLLAALVSVGALAGCSPMREIAHAPTRTALRWWGIGYSDGYHRCPTFGEVCGGGSRCSTCNFVAPMPYEASLVAPAMYPLGSQSCQSCQSGMVDSYPMLPTHGYLHSWEHTSLPSTPSPNQQHSSQPHPKPLPMPAPQSPAEEDGRIWGFEPSPSDRKPDGSAQPRAAVERQGTSMTSTRLTGWDPRRSMR